jgi:PAS domain-containing protein
MPDNSGRSRATAPVHDPNLTALFPDQNPHPVLRIADGRLVYANPASEPVVAALGIKLGDTVPAELGLSIDAACSSGTPIELDGEGRTYELRAVAIPQFGFTNVYGTDITAEKAMNKYPDQNPNPVLRIARDGSLEYANPASELVRRGLGIVVGEPLPDELLRRIRAMAAAPTPEALEVEADGRIFTVLVVSLFEYGSINLYGTDITAARQVERALRENERLLLNILPLSIATRLRDGEVVIADRFDEMAILFADVVNFTGWSSTA